MTEREREREEKEEKEEKKDKPWGKNWLYVVGGVTREKEN